MITLMRIKNNMDSKIEVPRQPIIGVLICEITIGGTLTGVTRLITVDIILSNKKPNDVSFILLISLILLILLI